MASVKESIEQLVASHPVVVFTKSTCMFCKRTKALLTELNVKFEEVVLDEVANGQEQQDALEDITGTFVLHSCIAIFRRLTYLLLRTNHCA